MKADRVLFLGNSITFHPAVPEDGFMNTCGMAASSAEHDYVHILLRRFAETMEGRKPESIIRNIADFEREHQSMDIQEFFKDELEFKADLLVMAIGENVPILETSEQQQAYFDAFKRLLEIIKATGCQQIIVRGCFWKDDVKDEIMRKACEHVGGHFVSISYLSTDPRNSASSEREYKHQGIANHPGDTGMSAIADAIWNQIMSTSS